MIYVWSELGNVVCVSNLNPLDDKIEDNELENQTLRLDVPKGKIPAVIKNPMLNILYAGNCPVTDLGEI